MEKKFLKMDLQLFSADITPINVTTQSSMSPTMKTFYDTTLLENSREAMVYSQFGLSQKMKGNRVEWRKFNTFEKAMTPLQEGVIPTGQNFGMTKIEGTISQHGDFTAVSDRLELESYDDVIFGATEEMGAAEGETYDTLTRNVLVGGNCVAYCSNGSTPVFSRKDVEDTCILTPDMVNRAQTWLKKNKAPKINGSYVALIHPSVAYDLRNSDEWKEYHKYNDVAPIFKGEIGELHGVRFVEVTNGKIWKVDKYVLSKDTEVDETKTYYTESDDVYSEVENPTGNPSTSSYYEKEIKTVYATLFLGKDAYGILDPEGEGMEMIIKTKEQIGGPLNQFGTIGYKDCTKKMTSSFASVYAGLKHLYKN